MGSQGFTVGQYHDPTPQKSISQSLTAVFQSTLIRSLLRNGGNSKGSPCLLPEVLTQRDVSVGPLRASELSCTMVHRQVWCICSVYYRTLPTSREPGSVNRMGLWRLAREVPNAQDSYAQSSD